jgi:hypothetical protein
VKSRGLYAGISILGQVFVGKSPYYDCTFEM